MDNNFFKYIELIEGSSAATLTLKLQAIKIAYQLNAVWSDGSNHYALINAKQKLPVRTKEDLAKIK